MPIRFISSDDPPKLTRGSGVPLVGMMPITTLMLTSACSATIAVRPDRQKRPEAVWRAQGDAQAAPRDNQETDEDGRRADEPQLLGDDGVDEVGVRLRQVEELLDAVHQSASPDAARADRDERLDDLEAVAERVLPRVEEGEEPAPAVSGAHDQPHHDGQRHEGDADDVGVVEAGGEDHDRGDQDQRHRRPEVGLDQDEPHQPQHDDHDRPERVADLVDPVHPALQDGRDEEDGHELRELGRLHAQSADREPPPCVVHRRHEQDRDEREGDDAQARPDEDGLAIVPVVDAHDHPQHRQAHDGPHALLDQEEGRIAELLQADDGRRAVDHDHAQPDQDHGREEEDAIGFELASHACASAPLKPGHTPPETVRGSRGFPGASGPGRTYHP